MLPSFSWAELLNKICEEYEIEEDLFVKGNTYPLIASKIMEIVQEKSECSLSESTRRVKFSIAKLVNQNPGEMVVKKYNQYFNNINPSWIVTTNYDNILEEVIGPMAYPILPGQLFYNTKNILPVYHIHGSILDSQSIVITNEDYAKTMRPSDYRHARLPILLKESTVLMIGYAIGDLNVISAIDYSKNVYTGNCHVENSIIQLAYTENPKDFCYEKEGIIIYEIDSIESFFNELTDHISRYKSSIGKMTKSVDRKQEEFISSSNEFVNKFDSNTDNYRIETIKFIYSLESSYWYIYTSFISLIQRTLDKNMEGAKYQYQFQFYDYYLVILLDLIVNIDVNKTPIIFITYLIEKLDFIAPYVGDSMGQSFAAYETWKNRMNSINKDFVEKIYLYFETVKNKHSLKRLIEQINV